MRYMQTPNNCCANYFNYTIIIDFGFADLSIMAAHLSFGCQITGDIKLSIPSVPLLPDLIR